MRRLDRLGVLGVVHGSLSPPVRCSYTLLYRTTNVAKAVRLGGALPFDRSTCPDGHAHPTSRLVNLRATATMDRTARPRTLSTGIADSGQVSLPRNLAAQSSSATKLAALPAPPLAPAQAALGRVSACSRCVLIGKPLPEQGSLLELRA